MHDWAEFRHFRYLLTILEKGGFRLAAEQLHTSQPNLTVQARQFQDYASVRLYHRQKMDAFNPRMPDSRSFPSRGSCSKQETMSSML